jgi:hypothetical protein
VLALDPRSIPAVVDVTFVRGARADGTSIPDTLLEVPHGATRTADFDELFGRLVGTYPDRLVEFFHVNTDVGAPEVAARAAALLVKADPRRTVAVATSRIPRTFVDCNRRINPAAAARPSAPGDVTPGLMPWMTHPADRALVIERYTRYRDVVASIEESVLDRGGHLVQVHTYAPRSIDVAVDTKVVATLHAQYDAPEALARWPLRPEVDLIVADPSGRRLAAPRLADEMTAGYRAMGIEAAQAKAYSLHPETVAGELAARFPGRTLCYEMRRDLLVKEFLPFRPMEVDAAKVERHAAILATALDRTGLR